MAKPKKFRPAIGKRLKTVLAIVFALFALIVVNSVYLVSVTVQGEERQGRRPGCDGHRQAGQGQVQARAHQGLLQGRHRWLDGGAA